MRVSVCELPDNRLEFELAWDSLVQHVSFVQSDLVVLPEFPASPWFGWTPEYSDETWQAAVSAHERLIATLRQFAPAVVVGSIPTTRESGRHNVAFVWSESTGPRELHRKTILPEEPGFHEQSWYAPGGERPAAVAIGELKLGVLLCSELMAAERARTLGAEGAHVIAVPRATGDHERWVVASRMAAISSGAYLLSSNRTGQGSGGLHFGGRGLIVDPDGTVLAETTRAKPFATANVDLQLANDAKSTYPRYLTIP